MEPFWHEFFLLLQWLSRIFIFPIYFPRHCLSSSLDLLWYFCSQIPVCMMVAALPQPKLHFSTCQFFFFFFGTAVADMEVPRLGVKSDLQPWAYTTAKAMRDPSHIFHLHRSSWQRRIPNPLIEARDQTHILLDTSWIRFRCATKGTPDSLLFKSV